ncbi:hypothetical protein [Pseudorhodobacter sp.]|uniref:hypothetical protein n=1 Tax=Pseudorhodobacter sp. TaxID=1934400 RepID=UPI0026483BC1|nr:hypothetical protein [Pseudorhodobacter sp.]MDN5788988.1 hypothetical protein [Pseudorhodobacter sp.]
METIWNQLTPVDWQARLGQSGACRLRQSWEFGAAMAALGAQVAHAQVFDDGREVAIVQLLQRRHLRLISQGPVYLGQTDRRRVLRRLARHGGVTVATPETGLSGWGLIPLITPRFHAIWALDQPVEDLRTGLSGKWRNRLLRAEDRVQPEVLTAPRDLMQLIMAEAAQRKTRGYRNLPGGMAQVWPGERLVIGWKRRGVMQSGMVFLCHGDCATYHLGWTSDIGRAGFAHGPILWQAALALRARGVVRLDLGEVNTERGAALARFKLGTGAAPVPRGATCLVLP